MDLIRKGLREKVFVCADSNRVRNSLVAHLEEAENDSMGVSGGVMHANDTEKRALRDFVFLAARLVSMERSRDIADAST
jgi:hypothetical protein